MLLTYLRRILSADLPGHTMQSSRLHVVLRMSCTAHDLIQALLAAQLDHLFLVVLRRALCRAET